MKNISKQLDFFLKLSRVRDIVARSFDRSLGVGIGFTDFVILYYLSQAPEEKMRRIDLAEKVALTPSGITRLLLPMEKIGLVKRESSSTDARVSFVKLAPGGRRLLQESLQKAELITEEFLPSTKTGKINDLTEIFGLFSMGQIID